MNIIKKIFGYFFRDELSIKHKLVNVILGSALLVQFPGIIVTIAVGTGVIGIITQILMFTFIAVILYLTNRFPDSKIPSIVIATVANIIVFPIMYFVYISASSEGAVYMPSLQ